jgi:CRISPR/Cas system-associated exonuclease Cas4 (RecB family)
MFTYNEIETTNDLGLRWYHTPNGAYPSITTILGTTQPEKMVKALEGWRNSLGHEKAAAHSKKATDHGTNVHLLCERYLKKQEVLAPIDGQPVPDPDKAAFNALKLKLDKIDEVWGQEVPLFSRKYEVAGRCDLVGKYKGVPVIVDFKTAGRIKSRADIGDYKIQLAFYAQAHNEMFGTDIKRGIILMVAQTGFPMEFDIELAPEYNELQKRVDEFWVRTLAKV